MKTKIEEIKINDFPVGTIVKAPNGEVGIVEIFSGTDPCEICVCLGDSVSCNNFECGISYRNDEKNVILRALTEEEKNALNLE